jgi:hypothetical protein
LFKIGSWLASRIASGAEEAVFNDDYWAFNDVQIWGFLGI